MICPTCGTENRPDRRFCSNCGSSLAVTCPNCGASNEPTDRFCGQCGQALAEGAASAAPDAGPDVRSAPTSERRLVSVLFADLVGFTSFSEHRDPETVREVLSRYFETCQQLIARYGGTVEKFIGDAVMAVWGTPTAQEDDAERAVRAALDLTSTVATLGTEVGAELQARAGVLTGEAAVNLDAGNQGMVAGDLVNTASRIQSVAQPGTVYVGEATRRATEAAIAYEPSGDHELKGKSEPVPLWRALRVVAGRKGSLRTSGLDAPFVGRDREMRLVKELFHTSAEERTAHLLSATGVAGVGKSRLSWEFEKYIDGLADDVWWHRGRCLAYGEGVAYWALAEMVRSRADIVEGEDPAAALGKLRTSVEEFLADPEERRWVEPRLAHLLGLEERVARDQADLFSAWRLFFERMSDEHAVVAVFEDLQWADAALMDFIEYLMEWSRDHPIFILTLSRPELAERRPSWGAGRRSFTSLFLEPLSAQAMDELLRGLAPGLPEDVRRTILERAEGIPLYAVETVRMLIDRGLLRLEDGEYHPTGAIGELEVPETLHALIAARLDGLPPEERSVLQDAAVLGKSFMVPGLASLTGRSEEELGPILTSLLRKEFLSVQSDPRSPERGQYGFLQDLVRKVAYDTLARKDRKARHLAAAEFLQMGWGAEEEEVVEVIASHLLEAFEAAPEADDAADIKGQAVEMLVRAGDHAAALAADEEAERYYDRAAGLADDPVRQAELHERAGQALARGGRVEDAAAHLERAIDLFTSEGATHAAARVTARLAEREWDRGRFGRAIDRMDEAFRVLSDDTPDEGLATLAAQLARFQTFAGQHGPAFERVERALEIAEALWFPAVLSEALNTKSLLLGARGRTTEAVALLKQSLELALEHDAHAAAFRAYFNLVGTLGSRDRFEEARRYLEQGLALARKLGNQYWEWQLLGQSFLHYALGRWDEALAMVAGLPGVERLNDARGAFICLLYPIPQIHIHRGHVEEARRDIELFSGAEASDDLQERAAYLVGRSALLLAESRFEEAWRLWESMRESLVSIAFAGEFLREAITQAAEAAFALGDLDGVEQVLALVDAIEPAKIPDSTRAHADRMRARLTAARGDHEGVEDGFKAAIAVFRELQNPFWAAVTEVELAEWLLSEDRSDEVAPLLADAEDIFERLGAAPWLDRLHRLGRGAIAATEAEGA